jgi:hypothetical protein
MGRGCQTIGLHSKSWVQISHKLQTEGLFGVFPPLADRLVGNPAHSGNRITGRNLLAKRICATKEQINNVKPLVFLKERTQMKSSQTWIPHRVLRMKCRKFRFPDDRWVQEKTYKKGGELIGFWGRELWRDSCGSHQALGHLHARG